MNALVLSVYKTLIRVLGLWYLALNCFPAWEPNSVGLQAILRYKGQFERKRNIDFQIDLPKLMSKVMAITERRGGDLSWVEGEMGRFGTCR